MYVSDDADESTIKTCHFSFSAYITKGLYISMYKEGDIVKKYATRIHGKKLISLLFYMH